MRAPPPTQGLIITALMASRANSLPRRSRIVLTCGTARVDRQVFDEVQKLVGNVTNFATGLAEKLKDTIERLPNSTVLVDMARQMAENWLNDKLCLVPPSGSGINSGNQMVVIGPADKNPALADSDDLFVGASRLNIATHIATVVIYRCSTMVACACGMCT